MFLASLILVASSLSVLGGGDAVTVASAEQEPSVAIPTIATGSKTRPDYWPIPYANCDFSTAAPILNVNDFICFLNKFAAGDPYANCDGSTAAPVLNVLDIQCFLNSYAAASGTKG